MRPLARRAVEYPWHPTLLAAALVLGFFNDTLVHPAAAIRAFLLVSLAVGLVTVATQATGRFRAQAAVVVTGLLVLVWTKHLIRLYVATARWMDAAQVALWTVLILLATVVAIRVFRGFLAAAVQSSRLTPRLNAAASVLLISVLATMLVGGGFASALHDLRGTAAVRLSREASNPDIYVILLDGYARADVLASRFDYDNSPFLDELAAAGFEVASRSHSPYLWTHLVLPAVLNMGYVEDVALIRRVMDGDAPVRPTQRRAINENAVFESARQRGYEIVATNSGWEEYSLRSADIFYDAGSMNEFELELLHSTFLGDLAVLVHADIGSSQVRDRITSSLAYLPSVAERRGDHPRLVFAHVPAPHQPTVFGPNGEAVITRLDSRFFRDTPAGTQRSLQSFVSEYRGEVQHLNHLVLEAINGILVRSDSPPVIVVMSDHGSASRVNWLDTSPSDVDEGDLLERTGILFAAYTPGKSHVFPDDVSAVNVFRHMSDAYFGTRLGLAPPPSPGMQIPPVDASVIR